MKIGTKEFYEILEHFERAFTGHRLDRENESLWRIGQVYQDGETNNMYLAYRLGYAQGRVNYLDGGKR